MIKTWKVETLINKLKFEVVGSQSTFSQSNKRVIRLTDSIW